MVLKSPIIKVGGFGGGRVSGFSVYGEWEKRHRSLYREECGGNN